MSFNSITDKLLIKLGTPVGGKPQGAIVPWVAYLEILRQGGLIDYTISATTPGDTSKPWLEPLTPSLSIFNGTSWNVVTIADAFPNLVGGSSSLQYDLRFASNVSTFTILNNLNVWEKVPLNTNIRNTIANASMSNGVITLPAGSYRAEFFGSSTIPNNTGYTFHLKNTSSNIVVAQTFHAVGSGYYPQYASIGWGDFEISAVQNFELQGYSTGGQSGSAMNTGESVVAASVRIQRVK